MNQWRILVVENNIDKLSLVRSVLEREEFLKEKDIFSISDLKDKQFAILDHIQYRPWQDHAVGLVHQGLAPDRMPDPAGPEGDLVCLRSSSAVVEGRCALHAR